MGLLIGWVKGDKIIRTWKLHSLVSQLLVGFFTSAGVSGGSSDQLVSVGPSDQLALVESFRSASVSGVLQTSLVSSYISMQDLRNISKEKCKAL